MSPSYGEQTGSTPEENPPVGEIKKEKRDGMNWNWKERIYSDVYIKRVPRLVGTSRINKSMGKWVRYGALR